MDDDANIFARIWREERLSCFSRSTLGGYLLGTLTPDIGSCPDGVYMFKQDEIISVSARELDSIPRCDRQ